MKFNQYYHFRLISNRMLCEGMPGVKTKGGVTVMARPNPDGTITWTGKKCSKNDVYSRAEGIKQCEKNILYLTSLETPDMNYEYGFEIAELIADNVRRFGEGLGLLKALREIEAKKTF